MTGPRLAVPAGLEAAVRQLARDFDVVGRAWIAAGEESPDGMRSAREGLRAYLAALPEIDESGVSRADRIRQVCDYWRAVAVRNEASGQPVRPVLSADMETRLLDRDWKKAQEAQR